MKSTAFVALSFALMLVMAVDAVALTADAQPQTATSPPIVIPLGGQTAVPDPSVATVAVRIALFNAVDDVTPIWIEDQVVAVDATGRYAVQFGATRTDGLPPELFGAGLARWIEVTVNGQSAGPRAMLVSVPYAAKAAVADTLAGKTVAEFVLADNLAEGVRAALRSTPRGDAVGRLDGEAVMDGTGTTNYLPKFLNSTGLLGDSVVADVAGYLGIGTATPDDRLRIANGNIKLDNNVGVKWVNKTAANFHDVSATYFSAVDDTLLFNVRSAQTTYGFRFRLNDTVEALIIDKNGYVGIGTTTPAARLDVSANVRSGSHSTGLAAYVTGDLEAQAGLRIAHSNGSQGVEFGFAGLRKYTNNGSNDLSIDAAPGTTGRLVLQTSATGNVGIGTASPTAKLHVVGTTTLDGNVTVNGNIGARYQDVAEWVDATADLDAGTVVIIDPSTTNRVMPSARAYDARVSGAISAQPGVVLGEGGPGRELVAQSGRVRIKADAKYGAIRPGDLLVTSPTSGHAMRSRPTRSGLHRPGTIIGKALEALPNGRGEILVLLTLQ